MRKLPTPDCPHNGAAIERTPHKRALASPSPQREVSETSSSSNPAGEPEADGQDLAGLLRARGFAHWHSLIDLLIARYAGWLTHYWLDDKFNLDVWPQADVIKVLVHLPRQKWGDDLAFALALSQCDFLVRLARDEDTGRPWSALSQSYADFLNEHRQAEPYWGDEAPWPPEVFARWALAQLRNR